MANRKEIFFRKNVLIWYGKNKRKLPWRGERDPYKILVSEIMLQQTQVDRVLPKYRAFLKAFPTLARLAKAKRSAVLTAWSGLGYNRRAVNLHRAVQEILQKHNGAFPKNVLQLEALPGIGRYTAHAILSFAFGARVAAVDTNHQRVVGRFFFGQKDTSKKRLQEKTKEILPDNAATWNHALMDFGALVCKARPRCFECPLREQCAAFPNVLTEKRIGKNVGERFFGSNRFLRGQIVDQLRSAPNHRLRDDSFSKSFSAIPGATPKRIRSLLSALRRDGVVTIKGRMVLLG